MGSERDESAAPAAPAARPVIAVRPVESGDVAAVSACLARAFDEDPVSRFLFPVARRRRRRLEHYFSFQIRHSFLSRGEAWTTDDLAGASLWMPPARQAPSLSEALTQLAAAVRIIGRQTPRAFRLLSLLEAARPKTPHHYLGTIGTDPLRQREGVGTALMSVVLNRLDPAGVPCFLESSREENLSFYGKLGFEVTGEVGGRSGLPHIWLMWRAPRSPERP